MQLAVEPGGVVTTECSSPRQLEQLTTDMLVRIVKLVPMPERLSALPLVSQRMRAVVNLAIADSQALVLQLKHEREQDSMSSLGMWLERAQAAALIRSLTFNRESNSSTSLHLDNIGQFSNLRSLRLVNIGCVSHILPQLSQLRGLQSLELVGANHGPYVDSAPSTLLPIPTAACWEPLVTALSGQLTKLVLVQCVTERASVPLMLRHLSALQELELSYIKHSTSQEDPWASRGRMDPMLQPWLAPKNVDMGNLPFVPGCLPHLKSLTLRGVHVEDASELSYLSGSHASTAAAGVDSSSGSSSCLAASMQQYLAPSRSRTGLTRFSAKRWTFDGAAGVQSLMAAIGCLTGLQELSVGQTCLSEAPAAAFRAIGGLSWLKVLDLHWSELPPDAPSSMFAGKGALPHLTDLNLPQRLPRCSAYNFDSSNDFDNVGDALPPLRSASDLRLLASSCPNLSRLNIRRAVCERAIMGVPALAQLTALQCSTWPSSIQADAFVIDMLKPLLPPLPTPPEPELPAQAEAPGAVGGGAAAGEGVAAGGDAAVSAGAAAPSHHERTRAHKAAMTWGGTQHQLQRFIQPGGRWGGPRGANGRAVPPSSAAESQLAQLQDVIDGDEAQLELHSKRERAQGSSHGRNHRGPTRAAGSAAAAAAAGGDSSDDGQPSFTHRKIPWSMSRRQALHASTGRPRPNSVKGPGGERSSGSGGSGGGSQDQQGSSGQDTGIAAAAAAAVQQGCPSQQCPCRSCRHQRRQELLGRRSGFDDDDGDDQDGTEVGRQEEQVQGLIDPCSEDEAELPSAPASAAAPRARKLPMRPTSYEHARDMAIAAAPADAVAKADAAADAAVAAVLAAPPSPGPAAGMIAAAAAAAAAAAGGAAPRAGPLGGLLSTAFARRARSGRSAFGGLSVSANAEIRREGGAAAAAAATGSGSDGMVYEFDDDTDDEPGRGGLPRLPQRRRRAGRSNSDDADPAFNGSRPRGKRP